MIKLLEDRLDNFEGLSLEGLAGFMPLPRQFKWVLDPEERADDAEVVFKHAVLARIEKLCQRNPLRLGSIVTPLDQGQVAAGKIEIESVGNRPAAG
jgi:hypothetical protein